MDSMRSDPVPPCVVMYARALKEFYGEVVIVGPVSLRSYVRLFEQVTGEPDNIGHTPTPVLCDILHVIYYFAVTYSAQYSIVQVTQLLAICYCTYTVLVPVLVQ